MSLQPEDIPQADRGTGLDPYAPASAHASSVVIAAGETLRRNNLASISYEIEATDQYGNTVKLKGRLYRDEPPNYNLPVAENESGSDEGRGGWFGLR